MASSVISIVVLTAMTVSAEMYWKFNLVNTKLYPNALCLDGTPAGYWFLQGYGEGADKYILHHHAGGWCIDTEDCYGRSLSDIGSSSTWMSGDCDAGSVQQPCLDAVEGIFSGDADVNPITYNWNKVYFGYCDGASFSGHLEETVPVPDHNTSLHYKGRFILDAVHDTVLLKEGMNNASEIIISGTSAGGLTTMLHADYLHAKYDAASIRSSPPRVSAVPDAGFFMDLPSIDGTYLYTPNYRNVFEMQGAKDSVNAECVAHYSLVGEEWKCFMAQYNLPFIKTELFIVNSLIDSWQGYNIMGITCDPSSSSCSDDVYSYLDQYRSEELTKSSLRGFLKSPGSGAWLVECFVHPTLNHNHFWLNVKIQSFSLSEVFSHWYQRDHSIPWVVVDGEWGSNTC